MQPLSNKIQRNVDNIILQKADKGNAIVIIDKKTYINKMNNILNDTTKFSKITFDKEKMVLDYLLDREEQITAEGFEGVDRSFIRIGV